jgi:hypothetical protein
VGLFDAAGLFGVLLMLSAYAGAQLGRLAPTGLISLLMNLLGSCLVMASLTRAFNLSAFLMEASWAAVAVFGLAKLAIRSLNLGRGRSRNGHDPRA